VSISALRKLAGAGRPELAAALESLLDVVANEAAANTKFADALGTALAEITAGPGGHGARSPRPNSRRGGRRPPGPFDPFEVYASGESELRRRLGECDVEALKDIVSEHGMDHDRLALKWKSPERLIERIVDTVAARSRKGDAFRAPADGRD
jgi:hypothetical protein